MEYPDLFLFPEGHPPSPYEHPVPGGQATAVPDYQEGKASSLVLKEGLQLRAVGWLERQSFTTVRYRTSASRLLLPHTQPK